MGAMCTGYKYWVKSTPVMAIKYIRRTRWLSDWHFACQNMFRVQGMDLHERNTDTNDVSDVLYQSYRLLDLLPQTVYQ